MEILASLTRFAGLPKIRKLRLGSKLLKIASMFIDYESEHLPPDGRIVEYSFVLSKLMRMLPCKVLDVGCVARFNYVSPALAFAGWNVHGIDIRKRWQFYHPNFTFVGKDIRNSGLVANSFDVILCISTVEHIGLAGYYGNVKEDADGDIVALTEISRIIKKGGKLLLTVPYCKNYSTRPGVRIYDAARLNRMLKEYSFTSEVVYRQVDGSWMPTDRDITAEGVICLELTRK